MNPALFCEFLGTFWLVLGGCGAAVLAAAFPDLGIGFTGVALAFGLTVLTGAYAFGPVSGAHFNPAVSIADAFQGGLSWADAGAYIVAQLLGAFLGVGLAHVMFGAPLYSWSTHARAGSAQIVSEVVATFGLLSVIWGCARTRPNAVAFAVGAYITAAYWFTSSTSFANPAVTLARALTDTFAGIRPLDVPGFITAQLAGGMAATLLFRWMIPGSSETRDRVAISMRALP